MRELCHGRMERVFLAHLPVVRQMACLLRDISVTSGIASGRDTPPGDLPTTSDLHDLSLARC